MKRMTILSTRFGRAGSEGSVRTDVRRLRESSTQALRVVVYENGDLYRWLIGMGWDGATSSLCVGCAVLVGCAALTVFVTGVCVRHTVTFGARFAVLSFALVFASTVVFGITRTIGSRERIGCGSPNTAPTDVVALRTAVLVSPSQRRGWVHCRHYCTRPVSA
jgi:hypothetical protein